MVSSVYSQTSRKSFNASMDEDLFRSRKNSSREANRLNGRNIVNTESVASSTPAMGLRVVSQSDIERMKNLSVIVTDEDLSRKKVEKEKEVEKSRKASQDRKRHMIEKEITIRARREKNAIENELDAYQNAMLTDEEITKNSNLDNVKIINSLAQRAEAFMIREHQFKNKNERQEQEKQYNQYFDDMMEKNRVSSIRERQSIQLDEQQKKIEARKMLEVQINERKKQVIRQEEAKAMEAQKILQTYKQYEMEEKKKQDENRENVRQRIIKVAKTNEQIKRMKEEAIQREKRDEQFAADYLRKKAIEEENYFKEQQRIKKSKEDRCAKLRAQQEKIQDNRAAQDELRAKRVFESNEKALRLKEKQDRENKIKTANFINEERKKQEIYKRQLMELEHNRDMLDDLTAKRATEKEHEKRRLVEEEKEADRQKYIEKLNNQLEENKEIRQRNSIFKSNEKNILKKKQMKEEIITNKIRKHTIDMLQKKGVKDKFLVDLQKFKPQTKLY